jgi:voltage-gated potassium channel
MTTQHYDGDDREIYVIDANYIIFIFGLMVILLLNSLIWLAFPDPAIRGVLNVVTTVICIFLLGDAFYRLWQSRGHRFAYLFRRHAWLAFLGSLPIPFFVLARFLHLGLGVRRLRRQDMSEARQYIVTKRAQTTLLFVVLVAVVIYELAVLMIVGVEADNPEANIRSANDALWWGFVTVSTVGYGDHYPITANGRIIGVALMTVGVGLFTGITSFMADWFRRPRGSRKRKELANSSEPENALILLENMRTALSDQEEAHRATIASLKAQLDELERNVFSNQAKTGGRAK